MARGLILETTFLIDLEREALRNRTGPAHRFLEQHGEEQLFLTFTVAGELAAGPRLERRESWEALVSLFRFLEFNRDVCWEYGRAERFLRTNGLLIGVNDLWIAATGVAYDMPVVTRNEKHYQRVPRLDVRGY